MSVDLPDSVTKRDKLVSQSTSKRLIRYIVIPFGGLALLILSFVGGAYYEKGTHKQVTAAAVASTVSQTRTGNRGFGGAGGSFGGQYGGSHIFGQVSSVNGQTFVLQSSSGTSYTVTITSSTVFADGSSASQIATGNTVIVSGQVGSSDAVSATRIIINPSFGGGLGSGTNQADPPSNAELN